MIVLLVMIFIVQILVVIQILFPLVGRNSPSTHPAYKREYLYILVKCTIKLTKTEYYYSQSYLIELLHIYLGGYDVTAHKNGDIYLRNNYITSLFLEKIRSNLQ